MGKGTVMHHTPQAGKCWLCHYLSNGHKNWPAESHCLKAPHQLEVHRFASKHCLKSLHIDYLIPHFKLAYNVILHPAMRQALHQPLFSGSGSSENQHNSGTGCMGCL